MFRSLKIRNFKSHKDTQIDFSPGLNLIVGAPQSGKSNILRAIRLLWKNRPLGGNYLSSFLGDEGTTEIELSLTDRPTVKLKKEIETKKTGEKHVASAVYSLGKKDYKGFGTGTVPDEVAEALNLDDLNIQKQLDQPYLITSSSGEIARTINKITKLEPVDGYVKELTTRINNTSHELRVLKEDIEQDQTEFDKYKGLDRLERIVKKLELADRELRNEQRRCLILDRDLSLLEGVEERVVALTKFLDAEKYILAAEKVDKEIEVLLVKDELFNKVGVLDAEIAELDKFLGAEKYIKEAGKLQKEIERLETKKELFITVIEVCKEEEILRSDILELVDKYVEQVEKLGVCPVCLRTVNKECIKHIRRML